MSSIVKHLPAYEELVKEIEDNPNIINTYSNYESFIGEDRAVNYLIKKLLDNDNKTNEGILTKFIKFIKKIQK